MLYCYLYYTLLSCKYYCELNNNIIYIYISYYIMDNIIFLPVSLGEAIDKLTILDIKLQKINDNRKLDVKKEFDLLYDKLKKFINLYNDLYESMKKVNLLIWNMMDILRDGNVSTDEYLKICKECIEYNDIRFRVKNKINYISESSLKEQKSYKINRIYIEINNVSEDVENFIKPIKYYSFFYDEIIIKSNSTLLKKEFNYDPTIIFIENYLENTEFKKNYIFPFEKYNKLDIFKIFNIDDIQINQLL
jgi:hypothetical protein